MAESIRLLYGGSVKASNAAALFAQEDIDGGLIGGAALFGIGWGLVGICPGPALSLISSGQPMIMLFIAAMVAGILLFDRGLARVLTKAPARGKDKVRQSHTA